MKKKHYNFGTLTRVHFENVSEINSKHILPEHEQTSDTELKGKSSNSKTDEISNETKKAKKVNIIALKDRRVDINNNKLSTFVFAGYDGADGGGWTGYGSLD